MEWVETTGKTVAEALEAALDELGVDEDDAEVVIVAEPKSGILGIGRASARVRARVRPTAPRPKRPQRGRGRDQRRGGRSRETAGAAVAGGDAPSGGRRRTEPAEDDGAAQLEGSSRPAGMPRRRRGRGGGGGGRGEGRPVQSARRDGEGEMDIEQQAQAVERFVSGIVERFGYDRATTSVRVEDDHVFVDVTGEDLGLLLGQRGRTLDALQELARTVLQRRGEEPAARVIVDVAGYRARRTAALEAFVRRLVEEVLASGEQRELEPMSAADRKIVHDVVNTVTGVESTSEGVEPDRYVVLRPTATSAADKALDADEELD